MANTSSPTTTKRTCSGSSRNARWEVEFVKGKSYVIRPKSFHGRYLTPWAEPFLLGMTGEKVIQTVTPTTAVEWKPIIRGSAVQLVTAGGKFLRANWGLPPWRNLVTHSVPLREMTQDWVLWKVEVVVVLTTPHSSSHARTPASASTFAPAQARQRPPAPTPSPARARQRPNGTTKTKVNRQEEQSNAGGDNTSSDSESVKGSDSFCEIDCVAQGFSEIDVVQGGVSAAISYEDDDDEDEEDDEDDK